MKIIEPLEEEPMTQQETLEHSQLTSDSDSIVSRMNTEVLKIWKARLER